MGRVSAAISAIALGAAVVGCGGDALVPVKTRLYEQCTGPGTCTSSTCQMVGPSAPDDLRCTLACVTDADCPPPEDGSAAVCIHTWCRTAACAGPVGPGFACVDGTIHRCDDLAAPPCSQCAVCDGATQACDRSTETCVAKKEHGQPCADPAECKSDRCEIVEVGGTPLFDSKAYCVFPVGDACWPGDPCNCDLGACVLGCDSSAPACGDQEICTVQDASSSSGTCRRSCAADPAVCGTDGICTDVSGSSVCAAPAGSPRPPRTAGVPCQADAECLSGTCCPAANGETWGHCANDLGC